MRVRCTALNETAQLRLIKVVVNDNGGTAVPSDWTLNATPTGNDVPPDSRSCPGWVPTSTPRRMWRSVPASPTTSPNPPGHPATGTPRSTARSPVRVRRQRPSPCSLVIPERVGSSTTTTRRPSPWSRWSMIPRRSAPPSTQTGSLTADGPVAITGAVREPAVTTAAVPVGTYDLTETRPGHRLDDRGLDLPRRRLLHAASVTLALGATATCTITNTDIKPRLDLRQGRRPPPTPGTTPGTDMDPLRRPPATTPRRRRPATPAGTAHHRARRHLRPVRGRPGRLRRPMWICQAPTLRRSTATEKPAPSPPAPPPPAPSPTPPCPAPWDLEKSSDPASGSTVQPGDRITYTVTPPPRWAASIRSIWW